ncbi:hypothetical protein quinque_007799 [Culex quinquefasciatus]
MTQTGCGRGKEDSQEWVPVTKLGRLVRDGKIRTLEEIYLQTRAGQRTRFKTFVAIGDTNGHICLGVKCSKEVATAIRSAIILAKLAVKPVRRGYWGNKIGKPHTVLCKIFGKCGSVLVCLNPVLRGTAIGRPRSRRSLPRWPVSRIASESRNSPAIPIIAPAAESDSRNWDAGSKFRSE